MKFSIPRPQSRWRRSRHVLMLLLGLLVASALALSLDESTLPTLAYAWPMIMVRFTVYGLVLWRGQRYTLGITSLIVLNELILFTQYIHLGGFPW
ncbi:hypothetical protein [uncultured Vibrio sp.]|uniref:hypothetical protein n=1 Tax=uncultured Vibrio sp. TaxID=114054 RepID=UPI0026356A81|nr:hypothetical protein [uncultured Vibrio sp.]